MPLPWRCEVTLTIYYAMMDHGICDVGATRDHVSCQKTFKRVRGSQLHLLHLLYLLYLADDARAREHASWGSREHADRFRGQGQGW